MPLYLDDFGEGESLPGSPVFAIEPSFGGLKPESGRGLFKDLVFAESDSVFGVFASVVGWTGAGADMLALNTRASVETSPCPDAMGSVLCNPVGFCFTDRGDYVVILWAHRSGTHYPFSGARMLCE